MSKKDLIYKVGIEEISKRGFLNTRVQDIVDSADISIGTFYNYFEDKNHFLFSIYFEEYNRFLNIVKSAYTMDISEIDKILYCFNGYLNEVLLNPNAFKVFLAEKYYLPKILDATMYAKLFNLENEIKTLFDKIILDGQNKNLIKKFDPRFITLLIDSLVRVILFSEERKENFVLEAIDKNELELFILNSIKV